MAGRASQNNSRRWWNVARLTLAGTAGAIGVSLAFTYVVLFSDAFTPLSRSLVLAIVIPVVIAAPLFMYIGMILQDMRAQQQQLNRLATYDQTTGFMNGRTLATVVERRVRATDAEEPAQSGFLVVRLDNLIDIFVDHGFDGGNEALSLIASAIRSSVRESDTVGRLGPGEFGVFLPGASEENTRQVGERIRAEIGKASFAPGGAEIALDISTGGVVFDQDFGFGDMFRSAEHQLTGQSARSSVALARAGERGTGTARH
jgi:diguanylate cyclase